jgi:hypothetical protein
MNPGFINPKKTKKKKEKRNYVFDTVEKHGVKPIPLCI